MSVLPILPSGQPISLVNWAQIVTLLRQNPTSDLIKHFDDKAPGFDGKESLRKLGVASAVPGSEFAGPPPGARPLLEGETITGTVPVKEEERPQPKHFYERLPQTMPPP